MEPNALVTLTVDTVTCLPQVRSTFDDESLAGLARSIAEVGLLQPILVRRNGEGWVVVDGERRLRAARLAGLKEIAAIVEQAELSEGDVIQRQLVANCQRADLDPIEKARALERLMAAGKWQAATVARKLGLPQSTVSKLLALLTLPAEVQEQVRKGELPPSTAYEIAKSKEPETRQLLVEEARRGKLTRDGAARRARGGAKGGRGGGRGVAGKPALLRAAIALGERRSITIRAPELPVSEVMVWLEELVAQLRSLGPGEMSLPEAVETLRKGKG